MNISHKFKHVTFTCLISVSQAIELYENRIWHSEDGRAIEARVLNLSEDEQTVEMQRVDGLKFILSWDQLSKTDQAFLAKTAKKTTIAEPKLALNNPVELPSKHILKGVPMVTQKGNYCVPASATMIAVFHGIKTDQDQVAELSSEMSASNQGTDPNDMLLAMEKLGFDGRALNWKDADEFTRRILPKIRSALYETGPIYISFRANVFGSMGHGCVIVGYDDRKAELLFHNPWGNKFESSYERVGIDGRGVVFIEAPKPMPIATEDFVRKINSVVPYFDGNFLALSHRLKKAAQGHKLVWCSRRDARFDKRFAQNTARDDGRMILELAFRRNPAVFIPRSDDGETKQYLFVTRPPEGGARYLVRSIDKRGWHEPELMTLGSLTRQWVTAFESESDDKKVWELPMIELQADSSY
ncbi:MAG: papain-like cysteine protease family protein [Verrucomicrobiota bacterium]|nr:papain-like cysteine protease family protein [Verrucomicrobiota bacterium]